jgi:hypothetical protein
MAQAAKDSYVGRGRKTVPRTLSLDRPTDALLLRLSNGQISSFMRALIWKEVGRREAMAELRGQGVGSVDGPENAAN